MYNATVSTSSEFEFSFGHVLVAMRADVVLQLFLDLFSFHQCSEKHLAHGRKRDGISASFEETGFIFVLQLLYVFADGWLTDVE